MSRLENDIATIGEITELAPAKVNLMLRVVGRREDGYHLLEMVNVTVDFADEVSLELLPRRSEVKFEFDNELELPLNSGFLQAERNLAVRAARAFLGERNLACGFRLKLTKRIPLGAGLGGGSSNAAAVLRVLQRLMPLPRERLERLAVSLGADVPYLIEGGLARVAGIGEQVQRMQHADLETLPLAIILPNCTLETETVFKRYARTGSGASNAWRERQFADFSAADPADWYSALTGLVANDLESAIGALSPQVVELLQLLRSSKGIVAGVTGSGVALFALPLELKLQGQSPLDRLPVAELRSKGCRVIETRAQLNPIPPS